MASMGPRPQLLRTQQSANMIFDKSMLYVKLEDILVFTICELYAKAQHALNAPCPCLPVVVTAASGQFRPAKS